MTATVEARSESEAAGFFPQLSILLLGPHYAAQKEAYEKRVKNYGFPVVVIPKDIYGTLDGERLADLIIENIATD